MDVEGFVGQGVHHRPRDVGVAGGVGIDALAEIAGMSRSNFCERFSTLVGRSPLRYQNEWRLTLAKTMLSRQDARIGEIGFAIGYDSEAAFSRAYKAFFGRSPRVDNARPG